MDDSLPLSEMDSWTLPDSLRKYADSITTLTTEIIEDLNFWKTWL